MTFDLTVTPLARKMRQATKQDLALMSNSCLQRVIGEQLAHREAREEGI